MTNIKLPELREYGPIGPTQLQIDKHKDIKRSNALYFDPRKRKIEDIFGPVEEESDLDRALTNIRDYMVTKRIKLPTLSVQQIDEIYRFATLNNFTEKEPLDQIIAKEMARI